MITVDTIGDLEKPIRGLPIEKPPKQCHPPARPPAAVASTAESKPKFSNKQPMKPISKREKLGSPQPEHQNELKKHIKHQINRRNRRRKGGMESRRSSLAGFGLLRGRRRTRGCEAGARGGFVWVLLS